MRLVSGKKVDQAFQMRLQCNPDKLFLLASVPHSGGSGNCRAGHAGKLLLKQWRFLLLKESGLFSYMTRREQNPILSAADDGTELCVQIRKIWLSIHLKQKDKKLL